MYVIETKGTNSNRIQATTPFNLRVELAAVKPINNGKTYIDRYERKRTRTPYLWDARIYHKIETAERALQRARNGEIGQVGVEDFEIVAVEEYITENGDHLIREAE